MALLPIRRYGDPVLRRKARPVEQFDADLQRLIQDMFQTMYAEPGVGLAAPQVGVSSRVVVIDVSPAGKKKEPMALINPRIVRTRGRLSGEEGCLSFPGISVKIVRPEWVSVTAVNEKGLPVHPHYTLIEGSWVERPSVRPLPA